METTESIEQGVIGEIKITKICFLYIISAISLIANGLIGPLFLIVDINHNFLRAGWR